MSKTIQCKFRCGTVAQIDQGTTTIEQVKLHAVSGKENEPWSKWTPTGTFEITITNPDAKGAFVPGKNYLLEITEAPAEQA